MHPQVKRTFPAWSAQFEGRVPYLYVDVKGLVTTGVGNLVDPVDSAVRLPWTVKGQPAPKTLVRAEWGIVKRQAKEIPGHPKGLGLKDLHHKFAGALTTIRLSEAAIDELVDTKAEEFVGFMRTHYFPEFNTYPADAQLALLSMAWALGPGFPQTWTVLRNAVIRRDWGAAADYCKIKESGNAGVIPRNHANRFLFNNAAKVEAQGLPADKLWYPKTVKPDLGEAADPMQTELDFTGVRIAEELRK